MRLLQHLLLSTAMLFLLGQATIAREWTDATGKFKVEAELVKVEGGKVLLKKQVDGATIQVPIALLAQPIRLTCNRFRVPPRSSRQQAANRHSP